MTWDHYIDQTSGDGDCIFVATDSELRDIARMSRLALIVANLGLSRFEIVEDMADALYLYDGDILCPNGAPYEMPDIDDTFHDASFRWISEFEKWAQHPPRQRPQWRVLEKLRLIDLWIRISRPALYRHVER